MRTLRKSLALALLVSVAGASHTAVSAPLGLGGATGLSASGSLPVEHVGGRYHGRRYRGGWDNGNAAAAAATAGIIGLATGAIIGGALANQNRCYGGGCYGYASPRVRVYEAPPVVYEAPPVYAAPVYSAPPVYAAPVYPAPPVYAEPAPYGGPVYVVPQPYDGPATDPSGCYDVGARVVCPY